MVLEAESYRSVERIAHPVKRRNSGDLVYSSDRGSMCRLCGRTLKSCICRKSPRAPTGDRVVRVQRESKGRRGKTVTTATGIGLASDALAQLAAELKRRCGSGGSAKDGVIEIQGDHRDTILHELQSRGYTVKRAGG